MKIVENSKKFTITFLQAKSLKKYSKIKNLITLEKGPTYEQVLRLKYEAYQLQLHEEISI